MLFPEKTRIIFVGLCDTGQIPKNVQEDPISTNKKKGYQTVSFLFMAKLL